MKAAPEASPDWGRPTSPNVFLMFKRQHMDQIHLLLYLLFSLFGISKLPLFSVKNISASFSADYVQWLLIFRLLTSHKFRPYKSNKRTNPYYGVTTIT